MSRESPSSSSRAGVSLSAGVVDMDASMLESASLSLDNEAKNDTIFFCTTISSANDCFLTSESFCNVAIACKVLHFISPGQATFRRCIR